MVEVSSDRSHVAEVKGLTTQVSTLSTEVNALKDSLSSQGSSAQIAESKRQADVANQERANQQIVTEIQKTMPPSLQAEALKLAEDLHRFVVRSSACWPKLPANSSSATTQQSNEQIALSCKKEWETKFKTKYEPGVKEIVRRLKEKGVFEYPACDAPVRVLADIDNCSSAIKMAARLLHP